MQKSQGSLYQVLLHGLSQMKWRGVVLPCYYIISHVNVDVQYEKLSNILKKIKEGTIMKLEKA